MSNRHIDGPDPHLTPEQIYESFTPNQAALASELEAGIFAESDRDALGHFHSAHRQYTGYTDKRTYFQPEAQTPVIGYVADKIDAAYGEAIETVDQSPADALSLLRTTYDQYSRLARYKGHNLSDGQLARVYFPMRDIYRRAANIARELGDEESVKQWQQDWLSYSNELEEETRPYDEEYEERRDLYDRFLLNKEDGEIWDEVIHRAQHEDERGEVPRHDLQDISTEELGNLADLLRTQTRDEQYVTLTRLASNGEAWSIVLAGLGDTSLVHTLKRFLEAVVSPQEIEAGQKSRLPHAVILGGHDTKAIDLMTFSKDRPVKGGLFKANPIADEVTVIEPSEALRTTDQKALADETHVKIADGLPTDMPFENRSQELIVGLRNTESMNGDTLSDFYLELARVLKHGGVYVESNRVRSVSDSSFDRWKSLLAQMVVDTVEERGTIPDRMAPDREAAMLQGLGLTEQIFNQGDRKIRALVKEGAVKELGWHMLKGRGGVERLFHIEVGGKPDVPRHKQARQTTRSTVVW